MRFIENNFINPQVIIKAMRNNPSKRAENTELSANREFGII